jgi:hypothetical protein
MKEIRQKPEKPVRFFLQQFHKKTAIKSVSMRPKVEKRFFWNYIALHNKSRSTRETAFI